MLISYLKKVQIVEITPSQVSTILPLGGNSPLPLNTTCKTLQGSTEFVDS